MKLSHDMSNLTITIPPFPKTVRFSIHLATSGADPYASLDMAHRILALVEHAHACTNEAAEWLDWATSADKHTPSACYTHLIQACKEGTLEQTAMAMADLASTLRALTANLELSLMESQGGKKRRRKVVRLKR